MSYDQQVSDLERELAFAKASDEAHWRTLRECADILCLPDESPSLLPEKIRLLQLCAKSEKQAKVERGDMLIAAEEKNAELTNTVAAFVQRDTEITAKLGTETARLDFLQSQHASAIFNPHMNFYQIADTIQNKNIAADETLRGAIDAALRANETPS